MAQGSPITSVSRFSMEIAVFQKKKNQKIKRSNNENRHFKSVILSIVHFAFFPPPFSLLVPLDPAGNADQGA